MTFEVASSHFHSKQTFFLLMPFYFQQTKKKRTKNQNYLLCDVSDKLLICSLSRSRSFAFISLFLSFFEDSRFQAKSFLSTFGHKLNRKIIISHFFCSGYCTDNFQLFRCHTPFVNLNFYDTSIHFSQLFHVKILLFTRISMENPPGQAKIFEALLSSRSFSIESTMCTDCGKHEASRCNQGDEAFRSMRVDSEFVLSLWLG